MGATTTAHEQRAPRRLWRLSSWLIGHSALHAHRLVSDGFAAEGYRRPHFTVLVALSESGAASQATLGRRLAIDGSDMVAVIGDLERDGLVDRCRDEEDRRRNVVRLTPAGERTLERLDARVEAAQDELLAPLSAAERSELRRLLTRVVEHHAGKERAVSRTPDERAHGRAGGEAQAGRASAR
jgi:MarR family transcriptional regulator, lower aerobic nicotinate degradation pathway regulator